jgi:hypothetical protein
VCRGGTAGIGFLPPLIAPVIGFTTLLDKFFPTDEEGARRELERYQDTTKGPGPAIDPTIWWPLVGLLGMTAIVYTLSTKK